MRGWIDEVRKLSGRLPRRYGSIEEAFRRMQEENKHLSPAQARHLTEHGVNQNEDGTYSWKFDNYVRAWQPYDMTQDDIEHLWTRIVCPTLLVYGKESRASNPQDDGRIEKFPTAKVVSSTMPATAQPRPAGCVRRDGARSLSDPLLVLSAAKDRSIAVSNKPV